MHTRVWHCTELDSIYASRSSKPVAGTCSGRHGAPTAGVEHAVSTTANRAKPNNKNDLASIRWSFTESSYSSLPGYRLEAAYVRG
jgi:hypothetical protein